MYEHHKEARAKIVRFVDPWMGKCCFCCWLSDDNRITYTNTKKTIADSSGDHFQTPQPPQLRHTGNSVTNTNTEDHTQTNSANHRNHNKEIDLQIQNYFFYLFFFFFFVFCFSLTLLFT